MNDYGRDRYSPPTPAEDRQRLRAARIRTEAENLAAQLIDQGLDKCAETGVDLDDVISHIDDHDLFARAIFDAAAKRSTDLYSMLLITATRLIEEKLKQRPTEAEQRAIEWHEQRERSLKSTKRNIHAHYQHKTG